MAPLPHRRSVVSRKKFPITGIRTVILLGVRSPAHFARSVNGPATVFCYVDLNQTTTSQGTPARLVYGTSDRGFGSGREGESGLIVRTLFWPLNLSLRSSAHDQRTDGRIQTLPRAGSTELLKDRSALFGPSPRATGALHSSTPPRGHTARQHFRPADSYPGHSVTGPDCPEASSLLLGRTLSKLPRHSTISRWQLDSSIRTPREKKYPRRGDGNGVTAAMFCSGASSGTFPAPTSVLVRLHRACPLPTVKPQSGTRRSAAAKGVPAGSGTSGTRSDVTGRGAYATFARNAVKQTSTSLLEPQGFRPFVFLQRYTNALRPRHETPPA